jgi:hypothetical protein
MAGFQAVACPNGERIAAPAIGGFPSEEEL